MNILRIYFSVLWRDSSTPCPWALCDEVGLIVEQGISPLALMPKTRDCIGILASDRILHLTTMQPPGNKRRWQNALPFLVEEYALSDPDDIHAIATPSPEAGKIVVSVVAKSWLKQIVAETTAAGLPLRRLISETLMPALKDDSWTLVWDGESGFLRTSPLTGLALDCGNLQSPPLALTLSLVSGAPVSIQLRFVEPAGHVEMPSWPLPLALGKSWDWRCAPIAADIPNLLQGDFAPPMRLFDGLSKLRPALFILLAVLVIEVFGTHLEWIMLANEKRVLTRNMEQVFHGTFGEDSELIDAPLQMQRKRAALRHAAGLADNADFLPLLDKSVSALGTDVRGINYESGKLELDIKLANAAALHSLERKFQMDGQHVRSSEVHDLADGIEAKISLSLEGL